MSHPIVRPTAQPIVLLNHGYPRIGDRRELKRLIEAYWVGTCSRDHLRAEAQRLRAAHWARQAAAGLDVVPVGDFSLYDPLADLILALGLIPKRFAGAERLDPIDRLFYLARGRDPSGQAPETHALEMTKWFDTNYHALVPEIDADAPLTPDASAYCKAITAAQAEGHRPLPVLPGPLTLLTMAKSHASDAFQPLDRAADVVAAYGELLLAIADTLAAARPDGDLWIELDEPALALELDARERRVAIDAFTALNERLAASAPRARLLVAVPFGRPDFDVLTHSPAAGWHIDLTRRDGDTPEALAERLAAAVVARARHGTPLALLSLGAIDGRNVWAARLAATRETVTTVWTRVASACQHADVEPPTLGLAPSCTLALSPVSVRFETQLAARHPALHAVLAFADEKLAELAWLRRALTADADDADVAATLRANTDAWAALDALPERRNRRVRERVAALTERDARRPAPYPERAQAQRAAFALPPYPTTTIGSFPQTPEIRALRRDFRAGRIDAAAYTAGIQREIDHAIDVQARLGIDVFVHGEAERNDMVEFFGELLDGYAFTQNGWVQSYGTRCVKPPILWADVERTQPLGTEWLRHAHERARTRYGKPVKGMLTGPVTLLKWAFPRDDLAPGDIALQLALALREEIDALVDAGLRIVQVDEPAFREGLPLKRSRQPEYLAWAIRAFRVATAHPDPSVQIHTHMCYSEFNDIIDAIAALDADVITIETARSNMEILDAFERFDYPNEVGPGVYDIHSPRVPETAEMIRLLERASRTLPPERLWVNPDCGLKTRAWPETEAALARMVEAAQHLRERLRDGNVGGQTTSPRTPHRQPVPPSLAAS